MSRLSSKKDIIRRIKGVKDILPQDAALWQWVEDSAKETFESFCYSEIRIPTFEKTGVFARAIGDTTDIVEKEMYTFTDRGGESLTLRPEGTASVVRAYVENAMYNNPGPQKLYYMGPMFRAERPQAGRYRQFHQIGAELFGPEDPAADAETIQLLMAIFQNLGVDGLSLNINSLGCPGCRPAYRQKLFEYLDGKREALCENCNSRIDRNPLRALDCKSKQCGEVALQAPFVMDSLCGDCKTHFDRTTTLLKRAGVEANQDHRLVRGLDYYSRTAFEVTSNALGAQDAVAGGGRYNSLVEQFGGPPVAAIGFAIGMERLISLIKDKGSVTRPEVFFAPLSAEAEELVFKLAPVLRNDGFLVDMAFGEGNLKKQLKKADRASADIVVIIGENELANSSVLVKSMSDGQQNVVLTEDLVNWLNDYILGDENIA